MAHFLLKPQKRINLKLIKTRKAGIKMRWKSRNDTVFCVSGAIGKFVGAEDIKPSPPSRILKIS
jgi:hypothetical protein